MSPHLRETIKTLEKRVEELGQKNGELQRELRLSNARHERELEQTGDEYKKALLAGLDEIQRLNADLDQRSVELAKLATDNDVAKELAEYRDENARLVEFVQMVADSGRTKFAPEAKKILGQ